MIGPGTLERLLAASPYNVVRLILPASVLGDAARGPAAPGPRRGGAQAGDDARADATGADATRADVTGADATRADATRADDPRAGDEAAAARLHGWLADGALTVDDAPALYVYEQCGAGWVQRGLIGLVGVGTDAVHPHEGVMAGPVAGRRELMKATQSNLEPILLVYNGGAPGSGGESSTDGENRAGGHGGSAGPGAASRLTDRTADRQPPLARAVTDDGVTHTLWAVTDPDAQAAIARDLATRTALIADGHHRYAAYRELRAEEHRAREHGAGEGAGPWDFGLAFLVDADKYPLRLGAIHRVLPGLPLADAVRLASGAFTVTGLGTDGTITGETATGGITPEAALGRLAAAGESGTAFLLAGQDGYWLLTDPDEGQLAAAMPPGASPRWRALDASVMQELLFARLWSIRDNEHDVLISHDAAEAVRMAADSGGTAVICNPMPLAAVMDIAAHGEKVPRKSTSFGPKPRTGLVLRTFSA